MRQIVRVLAASFLALLGLAAGHANAVVVCNNCAYVPPATYLGAHGPGDSSTFNSGSTTGTQTYIFNISSPSLLSAGASFSTASGNAMAVYAASATCGAAGAACSGVSLGSVLVLGTATSPTTVAIASTPVLTGRYALLVNGVIPALMDGRDITPDLLASSGILQVSAVPEPASLALMGLGLAGLLVWRQRRA